MARRPAITLKKPEPLPDKDRQILAAMREVLGVANAEFNGRATLRYVDMLLRRGLQEAGHTPEGPNYPIEAWEIMEVHPYSNRSRKGYGMIHDTIDNETLTPKGKEAFQRIAEAANKHFALL